jgi:hypothetical protein
MIRLGTILAFFGFGSALLHFTSVQFNLLLWSEPMQPVLGLSVGAAGAVIILIKVLVSKDSEEEAPAGAPGQYGPPPGVAPGQPMPYGAAPAPYGPPSGPQPVGMPQSYGQPQSYGPPSGPQQFGPPSGPQQGPQQFGPPQGYPQPQNGMPPAQFGPQSGQQFGPRG